MMDIIPEDVIRYIYTFVPLHIKCLLSAKNYKKYNRYHLDYMNNFVYGHHLKLGRLFTFNTYVRRLIKNDYSYIFKFVLSDNIKNWKKMKKSRYKNFNYKSKLLFYSFYCIENKSNKCLKAIKEYL